MGKKEIQGHPRAHCEISGVQVYLIGGSSDAAFPCHFCDNLLLLLLLLLFTSTGSVVCAAVDVSKAFDAVGC